MIYKFDKLNSFHDYMMVWKRTGLGQDTSVLLSTGSQFSHLYQEWAGVNLWLSRLSNTLFQNCQVYHTRNNSYRSLERCTFLIKNILGSFCYPITHNSPRSECFPSIKMGWESFLVMWEMSMQTSTPHVNTMCRSEGRGIKVTEVKELPLRRLLV